MKSFKGLVILLLIALSANLNAQNREHTWGETPEWVDIPQSFMENDAVLVYYKQRYAVDQHYDLYYTVHKRIRILTARGLEDHARVVLPKFASNAAIHTLDARTIKKDGTIVDLNQSDIKKLEVPVDDYGDGVDVMIFSIPGAQVGDEIEIVYVLKNSYFSPVVYLHDELPVIQSLYELRLPERLFMDVMSYNAMVKPSLETKSEFTTYRWRMENLDGYGNDNGGIKALTIPYIFQVYKAPELDMVTHRVQASNTEWKDLLRRWRQIARFEDKALNVKYNKLYTDFIEEATKGIEPTDTVTRMIAIHNALNAKLTIDYGAPVDGFPLVGYLEKGYISPTHMICLYVKILDDLGISYSIIFGKDRLDGPIDLNVADAQQVSDYCFGINSSDGNIYMLTPQDYQCAYQAGEIPVGIQGTVAVIVDGKTDNEGTINLPFVAGTDNTRFRKGQVKVNIETGTVNKNVQETLLGSYSAFIRPGYLDAEKEHKLSEYLQYLNSGRELNDEVVSVSVSGPKQTFPYDFKLNYELNQIGAVNHFDENLYQLNFVNWMYHNIEEPGGGERKLSYYPAFPRRDQFKYYLVFDKPVELVNAENLNVQVVYAEHGAYELSVKQVNPTVILLESNYVISGKEFLPEEMFKLNEINEALSQATQTPLIFKVL